MCCGGCGGGVILLSKQSVCNYIHSDCVQRKHSPRMGRGRRVEQGPAVDEGGYMSALMGTSGLAVGGGDWAAQTISAPEGITPVRESGWMGLCVQSAP